MAPKRCRRLAPSMPPAPLLPLRRRTTLPSSTGFRALPKRAATLARTARLVHATPRQVKRSVLPRSAADLAAMSQGHPKRTEQESEDESTESVDDCYVNKASLRVALRGRKRRRQYLEEALEERKGPISFLEQHAVRASTRQIYTTALAQLTEFAATAGLPLQHADEVDAVFVQFFEQAYFAGSQPHVGERALAAWLHHHPSYGRLGGDHLPRAWRALKGWRVLSPTVPRRPVPWPVWCAFAWRLCCRGQTAMAVYLLLLVTCYLRPGELLKARPQDLHPPAQGIVGAWSLLLAPEERKVPTKTGIFSDSVLIDAGRARFLDPMLEALSQQVVGGAMWAFDSSAVRAEMLAVSRELQIDVTPYQARHSGPSIDMALQTRTLEAVQKRGRWMAVSSVRRYERHARLAAEWAKLLPWQKEVCLACERRVEAIVFGHEPGPAWPRMAS